MQHVIKELSLAVVLLGSDMRIINADELAATALGGRQAAAKGVHFVSLLRQELGGQQCDDIQASLEKRASVTFELGDSDKVFECQAIPLVKASSDGAAMFVVFKEVTELRRTDESLRRERQRHIFLMEALPGFLVLVGGDKQIHYSNRRYRKLFGKDFHWEAFCERSKTSPSAPSYEDILGQQSMEWEWRGEKGRYYQLYTHPMTDEDGSLKVIIHGVDITARKQAEMVLRQSHDELERRVQERTAELKASEDRFRAVVEDQTELICRFATDRAIYFVNGAFCRFFGCARSGLIGARFLPCVVEEDRWIIEDVFDQISPTQASRTLEFRVKPDGSPECWLRWNIRAIHDAKGRLVEYQAVGSDVTSLRQAEKRYFNLIQNMPIIIFALDYDFQLDFINDTCTTIMGYSPEEALSTPDWFFQGVHPEDRQQVREVMFSYPLHDQEKALAVEFRFHHRKGYLVNLLARPIPADRRPSSGVFDRVEGIIMDVTERTFLDKMLVQREKLNTLGAMSDELAHEIRNPLFALGGYARRLKKRHPELMEAGVILEEALRLEKLLDRIRKYLEPVAVETRPCEVNILLNFSVDILSGNLSKRMVNLVMDVEEGISVIHSDPDVLSQVFMNLITNGMNAVHRGGTIHVSTYETPQHVGVVFRLSPMKQALRGREQMFMPFEMDEEGVNLAVSYRLLKNVEGLLDIQQNGEGAHFTVLLPKKGKNRTPGETE